MRLMAVVILAMSGTHYALAETGIRGVNNHIGIGLGAQHIDYVEEDHYGLTSNGVLDSEKGSQAAIQVDYALQRNGLGMDNLYFRVSQVYARGTSRYDGYLQDRYTGTLTPYSSDTEVSSNDLQLKLGKGFTPDASVQLTPYVAYSYRRWDRDSSHNQYGYLEVYSHNALAAGVLAQLAISPKLTGSLDASIGKTFLARMVVEHQDEFKLRSRPIYTFGLGLDYALTRSWHAFGNYQYTQFRYGESDIVHGFLEPNSRTKLSQLFFGASYGF